MPLTRMPTVIDKGDFCTGFSKDDDVGGCGGNREGGGDKHNNLRSLKTPTALGCDLFVNRRIEISKLDALFPRIAPVRLFRRSVHDLFGLNTERMNRAVGVSHLYPVRHAKKAEQNALFGHKKYSQPNSRIETCRRFDYLKTSWTYTE